MYGKIIAAAALLGTVALVAKTYRGAPKAGDAVAVPLDKLVAAGGAAFPEGVVPASTAVVQVSGSSGGTVSGSVVGYVDANGAVVTTGIPVGIPVTFKQADIAGYADASGRIKP